MLACHAACRESYARQAAASASAALGGAAGATEPAGVVVFRRGKLPLRVGMSQEDFTAAVVMQAAAQLALAGVGYRFDDA